MASMVDRLVLPRLVLAIKAMSSSIDENWCCILAGNLVRISAMFAMILIFQGSGENPV
jgi:hypothetical protein